MSQDRNFTNSKEVVISRLLELLPLDFVKKEYSVAGHRNKVYKQVIKKTSETDIYEDFLRNMSFCHQHIHMFKHSCSDISKIGTSSLSKNVVYSNVINKGASRKEVEYLLEVRYYFTEVINQTAKEKFLKFLWPVMIILTSSHIEIRIITMEKNMKSSATLLFRERDLEEDGIISEICRNTGITKPDRFLDITKGVKLLWNNDMIDAPRVEHKNSKSTDLAKMDGDLTYKKSYPAEYAKIIKQPLRRMGFYGLDKKLPLAFVCEPEEGYLGFSRFQNDISSIDALIDEILRRN